MKKDYLIAVDLDGTLIEDFDNYDKNSFAYLKELSKTNYIVIATGRPFRSSKHYYDLLKLKTPIINYNGAIIHHPYDEEFRSSQITISKDVVLNLIKDNPDHILNIFCEIGDEIYLLKETKEVVPFLHVDGGTLFVGDFNKTLKSDPNGLIAIIKKGQEQIIENYIKTKYRGSIKIRLWYVSDVVVAEVYSPLTSKGNALAVVSKYYNVPREKIIAIGDGHNDIEMIEYAHIGVAMKESHPDLQAVAKYQAPSIKDSGVAKFLKEFFNN